MPQYLQLVILGDQQFEPLSGPGLRIQGCAIRSSGSYEEPGPGQTPLSNFSHYPENTPHALQYRERKA